MGLVNAEIELIRANDLALFQEGFLEESKIRKVKAMALVDSGAYMLCINQEIQSQLKLGKIDDYSATLADGTMVTLDRVGPIRLKFENRSTVCDAVVLPGDSEVLLGAIPMEAMDLVILPLEQKLVVNPKHPYTPVVSLKGVR